MCVFQRNILFDLHDRDLRARSTALLRLLDGKRIIDAVHLLVIAEIQLVLLQRATNRGLNFGDYERSEEHTSELQSHLNLVCRLLLEKKKKSNKAPHLPQIDGAKLHA